MRLLLLIASLSFGYVTAAQDTAGIFDELQENFWYLPTPDGKAELGLTSLGAGDTVVVLHGGPGNNFNYMVDAIRDHTATHYFLLFDQRGSIYSPVADSLIGGITLDLLVEDLEVIRKAIGQAKLSLLGHSFGTLLAMSYYMKYPDRVEKIILSAAMPPVVSHAVPFAEVVKGIHSRVKNMRERPLVETVLRKEGLSDERGLSAREQSDRYKITGLASFNMIDLSHWRRFKGGRVFYNSLVDGAIGSSMPEVYDVRGALKENPVPLHIIQGSDDYIDPAASRWNEIARDYSNVSISVVPQTSHYIWLDKPAAFAELLAKTLYKK